jgi:hypothetical protein
MSGSRLNICWRSDLRIFPWIADAASISGAVLLLQRHARHP